MARRVRRGRNITTTPQRAKIFRENPKGDSALKHARRNRGIPR